ncbi:dihydrolipoamide acetyltransferase family protein [Streptomyces sp. AC627_RSS907]|uniref:dihydrolipoamide acetyltransferase family protein n=1 Tax=Streptomyces sp. AC627_RSS907 TaxID=2823684 RepID=UPI001C242F50|nr:dihydrolipoamide acetyltransferase family protein [Streptomyces sp. AC627_RSS907]
MAQVLEFRLPDLGEGLTEAEIVRWMVEVGDVVAVDQPVVEVETAKAMVEVPCPYGGVVTARFGEEGAELPVGAPLLTVAVDETVAGGSARDSGTGGEAAGGTQAGGTQAGSTRAGGTQPGTAQAGTAQDGGEATGSPLAGSAPAGSASAGRARAGTAQAGTAQAGSARSEAARSEATKAAGSGNVLVGYGTSEAPARRRRVRPAPAAAESGRANGRVRDADPSDGPVPVISPLVRRLARQNGLDLRELTGSGPDGLILRADVEYALRATAAQGGRTAVPAPEPHAVEAPAAPAGRAAGGVRTPLKGVRGAVADKLSRSRREIPDATCWVDADATELMRARTAMNAAGGPKISLLALLARICTAALARFPELNSTVDTEAREVVRLDQVHLGFAAQTDRGLVVPVVRDAHTRDAEGLTAEFTRLTEAARAGRLTPGELTGGTFTLNNYGVFGVDGSTPIINHPEAAMLGVGRIVPKPWVHDGELAVRQVVQLSLTFDHRVCDGGTAGGFLRYVADCVEQPAVLLRTL